MPIGVTELLIVLAIVLVLFGAKRLVGIGSDLGKAIQGFKKGMSESKDEGKDPARLDPPAPVPPSAQNNESHGDRERRGDSAP